MKKNKVLNKLYKNKMNIDEAYEKLFVKKIKRQRLKKARFVVMRFDIKESLGVSILLNTLFFLPFPMLFINLFKSKIQNYADISQFFIRGITIEVESEEANIFIKTI